MYINKEDKERILSLCNDKIYETMSAFSPLKKIGSGFVTQCPHCKSEHGLSFNPAKKVFKCFRCGECAGNSAVGYLMSGHGITFQEALQWLAGNFNINLPKPQRQLPIKKSKKSYCSRMLADSGLTKVDITATTTDGDENHTIFKQPTFTPGTITEYGEIDPEGDDVIIHYYDLEGKPVMYTPKNTKGQRVGDDRRYFRIRYQYPEEHLDRSGRPTKYRSPAGTTTNIYIPQRLRAMYKAGLEIPRLYIQEGEKKAEKACKHGLPSVAVAGIQNLGVNKQLPECIINIVEKCSVKEVVFMLDADCFDLTTHIKINDPIERRPRNFYYAIKNYKEYFGTLQNRGLWLEIYFGHILPNEKKDKGIDDLLANTLHGNEQSLLDDINTAINEKEKIGKYVHLYKITDYSDSKLMTIWGLNSAQTFCERYKDILTELPKFTFGRHLWRYNDRGELETAQPLDPEEQFWQEKTDRKGNPSGNYAFRYVRAFRFLQNHGFGRHHTLNGGYDFIRMTPPFVKTVQHWEIRDYLTSFAEESLKENIVEMLFRGSTQFLGPDKLSHLKFIEPSWFSPQRGVQYLYFKNKYWEVSKDKIAESTYDRITHNIWADDISNFSAEKLDPLIRVSEKDGIYSYDITPTGKKCHFLAFLENASNFTWRKKDEDITEEEKNENAQHLIAKLCAIGYLAVSYKDYSAAKAVVGIDGKQSDIGVSNGRTGKSLLGELMKRVVVTLYLGGKKYDLAKDQFIWTEMSEKTKVVFIDDVRKDFDFENIFPNITGSWTINYKSGGRITLDFSKSPKIYLTTNHSISGDGSSFLDRQWNIAFSDYYSDSHKPIDDFGIVFFEEWDFEQWNLVWNMVAQCIQLYFRFGVVESPSERIEIRRLRQDLGEEFILWADEYFSDQAHLNNSITRKDMYDALLANVGVAREKFYTPTIFKKKIVKYCQYRGYLYNPHRYNYQTGTPSKCDKDGRPDMDDKRNGIEWILIGTPDYYDLTHDSPGDLDIFNDEIDYTEEDS